MAMIAIEQGEWASDGGAVVATVMSIGVERRLGKGHGLVRTRRAAMCEEMRARACNVGGAQSGTYPDDPRQRRRVVAGLQILAAMVEAKRPASELLHQFDPVPQLLKNVRFNGGAPLDSKSVKDRIAAAESELEGHGRLVIRKSGTEPLIRVMAEGDDPAMVERLVDDICEAVAAA